MEISILKDGGFEIGECHVTGEKPHDKPYVWIGEGNRCIAVIEEKQMNRLVLQWARANKACTGRKASVRRVKSKSVVALRQ